MYVTLHFPGLDQIGMLKYKQDISIYAVNMNLLI